MELNMLDLHIITVTTPSLKTEKNLQSSSSQVPDLEAHWATLP